MQIRNSQLQARNICDRVNSEKMAHSRDYKKVGLLRNNDVISCKLPKMVIFRYKNEHYGAHSQGNWKLHSLTGQLGLIKVTQEIPKFLEIENLSKQICDKYYDLVEIVDKIHKANGEEEAAAKALKSYIANQE